MKLLDFVAINVGDFVIPVTPAGLQLADGPVDGGEYQRREVTCVFKGVGKVIEINDIEIDYDTWESFDDCGVVSFRNLKIVCSAGVGWGGAGAVLRKDMRLPSTEIQEHVRDCVHGDLRARIRKKRTGKRRSR